VPNNANGRINVLLITPPSPEKLAQVNTVSPERINVSLLSASSLIDANGLWPPAGALTDDPGPASTLPISERLKILREAEIIFLDIPYPKHIFHRAPSLKWVHVPYAGVSDLWNSDIWGEPVLVTSSRGFNGVLPIAETVIGAIFMFARGLNTAALATAGRRLDRTEYKMAIVNGKTIGIVGLGGIGIEVARLAKAVGMRVIASNRTVTHRLKNTNGIDEIFPASDLDTMLGECDYVALCTMLTRDTERMFNTSSFAAMKHGAYILNIARGELIDEEAMKMALDSGQLAGAYLDVYADEYDRSPDPELSAMPNVVFTPHNADISDASHAFGIDVFCTNLSRYLSEEPLLNVINWTRGY
jgi:phosphoglycerate dehydrogenase-like enzyme